MRFGSDAVFNCKTNDPTARVTLNVSLSGYPSNVPVQPGKITRNGTTFTVHNIIVHDGGKYMCVAERGNRQVIKRDILLTIDTSEHLILLKYSYQKAYVASILSSHKACKEAMRYFLVRLLNVYVTGQI